MTAPSIASVVIPATMVGIGDYQLLRQPLRAAAAGRVYGAGKQQVIWNFDELAAADFDWIRARLAGADSASVQAVLWTDSSRRVLYTMTSGILWAPQYANVRVDRYMGVKLLIDWAMPIVAGLGSVLTVGTSLVGGADTVRYG